MKSMIRGLNTMGNGVGKALSQIMTGIITSISSGGKQAHALNNSDAEFRELHIVLPYGISSSALDGMVVQIVANDQNNGSIVGVMDMMRPDVVNGETIIYSHFGSKIQLLADGDIVLDIASGKKVIINGDLVVNGTINNQTI